MLDNDHDLPAITLMFDSRLRVAGEVLEGEVHLNFPILMKDKVEEVHIKLCGSVYTRIVRKQGEHRRNRTQRVFLLRDEISLWEKGSSLYPPPDSHILRLPFRFTLPHDLPPSCDFSGYEKNGTVGYFIEAVGQRDGLHFDRRILRAFALVPSNPEGALLRASFQNEWTGSWKALVEQREIRRGIWGDYSHVKMTLVLPDIEVLPILTPIPFTLNIITLSKPCKQDDSPSDKPIFPAPPLTPDLVEFELQNKAYICAYGLADTSTEHFVAYVGGMGPGARKAAYDAVQVEVMDKVWIPSGQGDEKGHQKGQWQQEVLFKSVIWLACPPSFSCPTMGINHSMRLTVDFPGIGNDLRVEFPVNIASCMSSTQGEEAATGWGGPPPELDLPPGYFEATAWHHEDDKE